MCDQEKGVKSEGGQEEATTVLQLRPVKYQLELVYLGSNRIEREDDVYRCKFDLTSEGSLDGVNPCTTIENAVRDTAEDDDSDLAARSRVADGTPVEPAGDSCYRVMITDNHGTRTSESLSLLSRRSRLAAFPNFNGDRISNPAYYEWAENNKNNWIPDVRPLVPFRVIVRKFVGGTQVAMDNEDLSVVFEVKDPKEDLDQNDGQRQTFLEGFFTKYNRVELSPWLGDDNALTWFKGLRLPPPGEPGVKATEVLRRMSYAEPPVVKEAHANEEVLPFSELSEPDGDGPMNAKFPVEPIDDPDEGFAVGISDVGFYPWPAAGDNYRFLISLKEGDADIRDTEANGGPVALIDDQQHAIEKADPVEESRWYTTPRFAIWRKIEFKLNVRATGTVDADITWANITTMYQKMFTEVVAPELSFELTQEAWRDLMVEVFNITDDDDVRRLNESDYTDLFPPFIVAGLDTGPRKTRLKTFARKAISHACGHSNIPDPDHDDNKPTQADGTGLCMFLCMTTAISTLGSYMGDRIFWMRKPSGGSGVQKATSTCAHEFGHVRSLRHAITARGGVGVGKAYEDATNARVVRVFDPEANCQILDHDGDDNYACLMAYSRPITAEPCALCALSMRFYDRVEIQKNGRYRNEIIESIGPVRILQIRQVGGNDRLFDVTGSTVNGASGTTIELIAAGPETDFTTRSGENLKGVTNLTRMQKGETWTSAGAGGVTESTVDWGSAGKKRSCSLTGAGDKVVTFRFGNESAEVTLRVP